MAAAGLWTTPTDLAKVGVELLRILNTKYVGILRKDTLEAMLQPQLIGYNPHGKEFCGIGFFCNGENDSFHFGHSGEDEGFMALVRFYKNTGKGAIVMVNSNEGYPLLEEVMRAIAREYKWPKISQKSKASIHLRTHRYTGLYTTNAGLQFNVLSLNGNLLFQIMQQPPLPIFPVSELEFFANAVNATILFDVNDNEDIIAMRLRQAGQEITAMKVKAKASSN